MAGMNEQPLRRYQPRALLCLTLTRLWFLPSVGAVLILALGVHKWPVRDGARAVLRAVGFEEWIAAVVLLAHPVLWIMARRFAATEPFREIPSESDETSSAGEDGKNNPTS